MSISREIATEAMMNLVEGSHAVASGIPQHLLDHPQLDNETKEILEAVVTVIPLLSSIARQSFLKALDAEDAIDKLNDWIKQNTEIK
jgi:hypothetical protein